MTGGSVFERALLAAARRSRGVGSVRRPDTTGTPEFDLTYIRTGGGADLAPIVVIPGGPGLGSILPYRTLRSLAARKGLDVLMVEHRGVGLSRRDRAGRDLPLSAMRIADVVDDLGAVLDAEGIDRAVVVGSSYGSHLAMRFGAAHPDRVAAMLLDSTLQSAHHLPLERAAVRRTLWTRPGELTATVRRLADTGLDDRILLDITRAAYELGGDELVRAAVTRRLRRPAAPTGKALEAYATRDASIARIPGVYEFDLVGEIGFRELGYGGIPDGLPLDPALTYAPLAGAFGAFEGEQVDLGTAIREFSWPLVLLVGTRDLRTPPEIAEAAAREAPQAVLVSIENGHSALDTHPLALLNAVRWLLTGRGERLPQIAGRLDRLPRRGVAARFPDVLSTGFALGL